MEPTSQPTQIPTLTPTAEPTAEPTRQPTPQGTMQTTITYSIPGKTCHTTAIYPPECECVIKGPGADVTLFKERNSWVGCMTKIECEMMRRGCHCHQTHENGFYYESFLCNPTRRS